MVLYLYKLLGIYNFFLNIYWVKIIFIYHNICVRLQDMETGESNLHPVVRVRSRLPKNGARSKDNFDNRHQKMANEGIPPAMADELDLSADKPEGDKQENTHEDVQQANNSGANRRMDVAAEDDTKEEIIFQPKSTPLYETVVRPVIPPRFDGESEFVLQ